jgi:hypothetical protein
MSRKKKWAVLVNYTDGKIRIDSPPQAEPAKGWEVLDVRSIRREAEEIMHAMVSVFYPEISVMNAAIHA